MQNERFKQASSINDEMGNQYLKFTYRLQLFLVKVLNDLNMRLGFGDTGIPGSFKLLSNMLSSLCGTNLTQNKEKRKEFEVMQLIRVHKMLFWDRSQYSEGSVF